MDINTTMSAGEKFAVENAVNTFNKQNQTDGRVKSNELGKDDFLKLLIAQLQNQDPTSPMEDTQFISQMAQFSSLEQMTNMSTSFSRLASLMNSQEAYSTLGKTVELNVGETTTSGVVEAATRGENPQIMVNGMYYYMEQIAAIYTGQITNWSEVGGADAEIVLIGREAGSGTRDGFESITWNRLPQFITKKGNKH